MIYILTGVLLFIVLFFITTFIAYRITFAVPEKDGSPFELSEEEQYASKREEILKAIEKAVNIPYKEVRVATPDGLSLYWRLYEISPTAPTQILFHGYRSHALRDFSGGLQLALECGCNALLVDQRAHGKSGGKCLSFGILESRENYEACTGEKYLLTVPGAGHGLSYLADAKRYAGAVREFLKQTVFQSASSGSFAAENR